MSPNIGNSRIFWIVTNGSSTLKCLLMFRTLDLHHWGGMGVRNLNGHHPFRSSGCGVASPKRTLRWRRACVQCVTFLFVGATICLFTIFQAKQGTVETMSNHGKFLGTAAHHYASLCGQIGLRKCCCIYDREQH